MPLAVGNSGSLVVILGSGKNSTTFRLPISVAVISVMASCQENRLEQRFSADGDEVARITADLFLKTDFPLSIIALVFLVVLEW